MTRSQRRWHFGIWLVLAPLVAAGLLAALRARPATPIGTAGPERAGAALERIP